MKKVLFISHDASRTGAPIVFLNFLRWFKDNTDIPFQILLRRGGELEPEFAALAPTLVHEQNTKHSLLKQAAKRLFKDNPIIKLQLQRQLAKANIGLIYSNTATNGNLLQALSHLNCPVISHIHELEIAIKRFAGDEFNQVKVVTNHYIACSGAVKSNLIQEHSISANKIDVIYETIPAISNSSRDWSTIRQQIRASLHLPDDAVVVGGSGTTDWRKGSDVFIQLARTVQAHSTSVPIYFLWVGGASPGTLNFWELQHDVKNAGLEGFVNFLGQKPNPLDYFAAFDIFALTSREDPYPLVCLEVASLGKPILCFDHAGGEKEFVESDCGFVVPYLDIQTMAEKIIALTNSVDLRQSLGGRGCNKVKEKHDVSITSPKIIEVIEKFMS
ncbi:glycosyltransferase [Umezakia ovalisporum]|uniref:glycosyltransferase n=1 Tax=Umezakia ovalisporum TaxID=75695 RepID=UPI0026A764E5